MYYKETHDLTREWYSTPSDPQSRFCSMAMLTVGLDQTYEYYHCGPEANTAHYMISPKAAITTSPASVTSSTVLETSVASLATPARQLPSSSLLIHTSPPSATQTTAETQNAENTTDTGISAGNTNSTGAIVGGVVGGLALLVGAGVVALWLVLKHRRRRGPSAPTLATAAEPIWAEAENKQMASWVSPSELQADQPRRSPIELPAGSNR